MTNGQILKKELGLENFKYVRVSRAVISSYKILLVFYDSYKVTMPVTNYRIKSFPWVATILHGSNLYHGSDKKTTFTPPLDIEDYNGEIRGALIIPINLAGDRFISRNQFSKVFENVEEKFVDFVKSQYNIDNYAVHVNPSLKEIREIQQEGGTKDLRGVYVVKGNKCFVSSVNLLHNQILNLVKKTHKGLYLNDDAVLISTDGSFLITEYANYDAFIAFLNSGIYNSFFTKYEIEPHETYLENYPLMQFNKNLLEYVTLYDLADKGNISDFTMTWRKDKNRVKGTENTTAKLIDCIVNESDNSVTFQFLTEATELGSKSANDNINSNYRFYSGDKGEVNPDNFDIKRNRSKTYELSIKILDILGKEGWLSTFEGETITSKELKEILEVSNVQVFSNSPGFHWQGCNFNLSQLDGSMYPTDIGNPVWGPRHGDASGYFLDKHLYGLLRQIKFFINPMASMLNKTLKDRKLI